MPDFRSWMDSGLNELCKEQEACRRPNFSSRRARVLDKALDSDVKEALK